MISFSEFIKHEAELNEIALKPTAARVIAISLATRMLDARKRVKAADDIGSKIDALADLNTTAAYISVLQIAIDQNDPNLVKRFARQ